MWAVWAAWCFMAGQFALALGYHFSSTGMYIVGGLFTSWSVLLAGKMLLKSEGSKHQRCMTHTARMEIEAYGMIVSQSVEWWLTDNEVVLCKAHPFPDLPLMVTGYSCQCPTKPPPPPGPGATSVKGGYIATKGIVHGTGAPPRLPPPNPGMSSRPNPRRAERR